MDSDTLEHKIMKYLRKFHKDPTGKHAKVYQKKIVHYHQKLQAGGGVDTETELPFDESIFGKVEFTDTIAQSISD